jgi:uncharacterized protein YeaO (DUF488 family)
VPLHTKRISDPAQSSDGLRVLTTRYRPRGVRKGQETWDRWDKLLAPSVELLDDWFGKVREGRRVLRTEEPRVTWAQFTARFRQELATPEAQAALQGYRDLLARGESVTVLCYCEDVARCHRGLLADELTGQGGR